MLLGGEAVRGLPLSQVYDKLSQAQKLAVAAQLGRIYREVQTVRGKRCGYPEVAKGESPWYDDDDDNKYDYPDDDESYYTGFEADNARDHSDSGIVRDETNGGGDGDLRAHIRSYCMTWCEPGDSINWDVATDNLPRRVGDWSEVEPSVEDMETVILTEDRFMEGPEPGLKARQVLILQLRRWLHRLDYRGWKDLDEGQAIRDQRHVLTCAWYMAREIIVRNPDVFEPTGDNEDDEDRICLHNPYLGTPENVMVEFRPNSAEPVITGIWDWGNSAFDPRFFSCRAPAWLWSGGPLSKEADPADAAAAPQPPTANTDDDDNTTSHSDDGDRTTTTRTLAKDAGQAHTERASLWYDRHGDEPLDPAATQPGESDAAGREIKRAFDGAAGAFFRRAAYNPDMAFARNLYAVVRDRPWRRDVAPYNLKVMEGLVKEWFVGEARQAARDF